MRHPGRWQVLGVVAALLAGALALAGAGAGDQAQPTVEASGTPAPDPTPSTDCAKRYVAGGDGVVKGTDINTSEDDRYTNELLTERLQKTPGPWCLYNLSADPVDTEEYRKADGQQAESWSLSPHLFTLQLGRQNSVIVDHVKDCLQKIKDHDFIEANVCALKVLADFTAWDKLKRDLGEILNQYLVRMDGNPKLVVAVLGYYNPYPSATSVATNIPGFCSDLTDTIPTCIARWVLLPPALITLDQVVRKLNSVIQGVVGEFATGAQGRFVWVNPYDKFKDHCTEMTVEIKTQVYHPTNTVHPHDSKKDFGCSEPWIASDKKDGTKPPFLYLTPAVTGVLIVATQTTSGMGINPNAKGHKCLSDLVWEATKEKLGVSEAPATPCES